MEHLFDALFLASQLLTGEVAARAVLSCCDSLGFGLSLIRRLRLPSWGMKAAVGNRLRGAKFLRLKNIGVRVCIWACCCTCARASVFVHVCMCICALACSWARVCLYVCKVHKGSDDAWGAHRIPAHACHKVGEGLTCLWLPCLLLSRVCAHGGGCWSAACPHQETLIYLFSIYYVFLHSFLRDRA